MSQPQEDIEGGWWEFQLKGPIPALEAFAEFLAERGSAGSVFSEAPGNARSQMVTAFVSARTAAPNLLEAVKARADFLAEECEGEEVELKITRVRDRDWAREWREGLKPLRLEPGVWIVPAHCPVPEEAGADPVLIIDPGLAFGTGLHATTRMCLAALVDQVRKSPGSVLDLGTGTAILAMAAAQCGASRVLALEIDPVALSVAHENLSRNRLADRVELRKGVAQPETMQLGEQFDLIVANLFPEVLKAMLPFIHRHLAPHGQAILAGILTEREEELVAAAQAAAFLIVDRREEEGWVTLLLRPCADGG
jgi:ribosomal protein L11 methyltransferase